jgi:hypothetical protein
MDPKKAPARGKTITKPCEDQLWFGTVRRDFSLFWVLSSFLFCFSEFYITTVQ